MRHVLVIEDQWLFAQFVADVAMCAGASSVAIADTADAAVELAHQHTPAVILCDVDLRAGGRGPDAVGRIHREVGPAPAIFITGNPKDAGALRHAAAILAKPVSPDQLLETFREIVQRLPARRTAAH